MNDLFENGCFYSERIKWDVQFTMFTAFLGQKKLYKTNKKNHGIDECVTPDHPVQVRKKATKKGEKESKKRKKK